ncbi:aminoglycoside phosphotransferase family protein [Streptomyces tubbatahanensis]|uniref:Aminoglycoside phosphotransferase family protein n=1 Tax=Streptomyces tubbatahanensis TaxID=2923272 RepID=A0ABY3Y0M1_9ACTN|nr:aminoglycoside phosphotransferase family protein [Streptomyces tubbatahanensis]UNT00206.1 aminoglycoside phosphotransferase family protein [Streptomyces tubbatahanensis]
MSDAPAVPQAALTWAARAVGPRARVRHVRRLPGGTHAATHLLRIAPPKTEVVLRRFPPRDPAPAREAAVLRALDGLDARAPRLLAVDPAGRHCGAPAVLTSRVPGGADIRPADPEAAARRLGAALALVHAVPRARLSGLRDCMAAARFSAQRAGERTDEGPAAPVVAAHEERLARQPRVLTHFDYWSGNVLWEGSALSGVVDWSGAGSAPRGLDVSWCRLDLVLLHGPVLGHAVADAFHAAYESAARTEVSDLVLWDLFALRNAYRSVTTWLPNYHGLGRTDLTGEDLRARHTAWTAARLHAWRKGRS